MKAYIGLGSNLGDKAENIAFAIRQISVTIGEVVQQSSLYFSKPSGFQSDNDFINAVILVETLLQPIDLLHQLKQIEKGMGRIQKTVDSNYQDRIIDMDILLYEDREIDLPELKVPHPRMKERDFVMKPLNELLSLI